MRSQFILIIGCSLVFTAAAFGQNWINPTGGSFGTPTNWSNDGTPLSPVFDLNSAAPGYTTSLPQSYDFPEGFAVQNDNVTVDLNGFGFSTSAFTVATTTGQTGSLTLVGPGTVDLTNLPPELPTANLDVDDQGGTGQLIVNDVTIVNNAAEGAGHFDANGLLVENGGAINLPIFAGATISNATFNDGSIGGGSLVLTANQVSLTNGSSIGCGELTLGNATLDDSTIGDNFSATIDGIVTLSDHAGMLVNGATVSGTVYVLAGTHFAAPQLTMEGGTLSVELNGQVSAAIGRPDSSDNGTLDFTLQSGFEPTIGEQFTIFNASSQENTGTFAAVNLPALPGGESWNISTLYTNGTISVVPEPISMGIMVVGIAGLALRRRG